MRLRTTQAAPIEYLRSSINLMLAIVMIVCGTWATNGVLPAARKAELGSVAGFSITSNFVQWLTMGVVFYACANWFQSARLSDPLTHRLITGSKTFRMLMVAGAFLAFTMNAVNGFVFVYAMVKLIKLNRFPSRPGSKAEISPDMAHVNHQNHYLNTIDCTPIGITRA